MTTAGSQAADGPSPALSPCFPGAGGESPAPSTAAPGGQLGRETRVYRGGPGEPASDPSVAGPHAGCEQTQGEANAGHGTTPTRNGPGTETTHARTFARSAASVGKARDFVTTVVGVCDRTDDIRVCVSELATNALQHTPAGRRFLVRIIFSEGVVRIEVHDASGATPCLRTPADTDERGRGLMLVSALADDWGVADRSGPGKFVWAAFKVQAAAEAWC